MPKRRLLWQLYPSYLVITLLALVGVGWFAVFSFEQFYLDRERAALFEHCQAIAKHVPDGLTDDARSTLAQSVKALAQWTSARLTVLRPSGEVFCDSGRKTPVGVLPQADVTKLAQGDPVSAVRYNPTLGSRQLLSIVPVERRGKIVALVEASSPLDSVDAALHGIRIRIAMVGLFIAFIAAVVSLVVSRKIATPIDAMRRGAERFARGEFDYKLPVPDSEELAGLAEALNEMSEQLRERIRIIVRQNNEQRAVLSSMVEGVLAVDNEQHLISLNKASAQLLGIDQLQAQGRSLQEVVRNTDLRRFIARALTCNEPIDDDVVLHGDHEGVLQARGAALHDAQGRSIGAVVVLNDVTDFRRLEHIRRDFVANVSHELKTPITSIKGFVETLLDGAMHNPADTERFLRIVVKQADRLNSIIEDLLSLSKIEQGEEAADIVLERGKLREVIELAVHNCEAKANERSILVRSVCDDDVEAQINAPLLEQAVINLLDNAIKYSEPGSEVQVLGAQFDGGQDGGEVTITVSDRGVGIAGEHLSRVFERFYRVDKARSRKLGGTGLGLAIVKHIVQAHHGRVAVKSTPGVGSVFTIHLPRPLPGALSSIEDTAEAS